MFKFTVTIDWSLVDILTKIDRFDASWEHIKQQKQEPILKELKSIATVQSIGASTRIEGSALSDTDISSLLKNIDINKLQDRDTQEVAGYHEALNIIIDLYDNIDISESSIKNMHNILLKYSDKDNWHKGDYKKNNNIIEITHKDGNKQALFKTTPCGIETESAMEELLQWYNSENAIHPLVKISAFIYELLSIHPFQDGNGRLARLLTTLLLLKNGYKWIIYKSLEREIEKQKDKYYKALMYCQSNRPNEDISVWIVYFVNTIYAIQKGLAEELVSISNIDQDLPVKQRDIYNFLKSNPDRSSSEIAKELSMPKPTVVSLLTDMYSKGLLIRKGVGKSTVYCLR